MCKHRGGAERIKSNVQAHVTRYRSIVQVVETAAYRRMLVRIQLERIRSAPRPYTGSGVKPSFSRRSLWVSLKPCRKRDEADNILQRTGIIGSNPIIAALDVGCSPSGSI